MRSNLATALSAPPRFSIAFLLRLDRQCRRPEETVAAATRPLEAALVEDADIAAGVLDQLLPLQRGRRFGDSDPAHAEHVREKFVRHAELGRMHAITRHQEPARKARLHYVEAVARRGLRDLLRFINDETRGWQWVTESL